MTARILKNNPTLAKDIDAVSIYLRYDDTLPENNDVFAGLLPFHVYTKLIPSSTKTIGIVTTPFKKDQNGSVDLNEAVVTAARNYLQRAYPNTKVSIRNKGRIDEAYARQVVSKRLICVASTFCLFPAIATFGEAYIVRSPLFGESDPTWLDSLSMRFPQINYVNETYVRANVFSKWNATEIIKLLERGDKR
jgi:hypothetical protein